VTDLEAKVMKHLEHLCVEIGPRPVGSKANQAAADYIRRAFEATGLAVEMQEFLCPLWEEIETQLEVGGEKLPAFANTWSPSCDVVAPAVALGTVAELEAAELADRVGVLYGDLTKGHGIGPRSAFYFPEEHQKIVHLLEEKGPAALLVVNPQVGNLERLICDWEFPIPSVTVPTEAGLTLLRHSDWPLHLRIESSQAPSRFASVVARKAGRRPERIMLLAHLDTQADTPGANDNGAGVAVLLALAERLAQRELAASLEWVAVNGEESGGLGDAEYLRRWGDTLEQVLAVINVDGVGHFLGTHTVTIMGGSQALRDQVFALMERYPGVIRVEPWYASDHTAFFLQGVPCIPISSVGPVANEHLPTDTVEWISPAKLSEVVSLITAMIEGLQDKSPDWCREANPAQ
jgi:aminopeptidase YwaD